MPVKLTYDELEKKVQKLEQLEAESKKLFDQLRDAELLSSQMFERSTTSKCLYNSEGTIIKANHKFCKMFGVEENAIINAGYNLFKDQAAIDAGVIPFLRDIFEKKTTRTWEIEYNIDSASESTETPTSKAGKIFLKVSGYPVLNPQGEIEYVILQHYDITERKLAEDALRKSENRFRVAFHTSPDSINLNRVSDGMYIDINEGFTKILGYTRDDVIGITSLSLNIWKDPKDRKRLVDGLSKTGYVENLEAQFVCKDKKIVTGLMSARIFSIDDENMILSVTRDISDLKRVQEMMLQSEKMVSVGGLAAGMAHEINNPLAGIIQNTDVMIRRLTNTELSANKKVAEELGIDMEAINAFMEKRNILTMADSIKETSFRLAEIVKNMLSFARKSDAQVSSHSINEILDQTINLAGTDFDLKKHYDFKNIEIKKEYGKDIPLIPCEAAKIQQVFLNIINNGTQAMQSVDTEKPMLKIRTKFEKNRKMVCVQIDDNGPGMDKKIRKRVFEPFFTTKQAGLGTGLGLSVSYFIIKENHCGTMDVISEPGKGASFIICLPVERNIK